MGPGLSGDGGGIIKTRAWVTDGEGGGLGVSTKTGEGKTHRGGPLVRTLRGKHGAGAHGPPIRVAGVCPRCGPVSIVFLRVSILTLTCSYSTARIGVTVHLARPLRTPPKGGTRSPDEVLHGPSSPVHSRVEAARSELLQHHLRTGSRRGGPCRGRGAPKTGWPAIGRHVPGTKLPEAAPATEIVSHHDGFLNRGLDGSIPLARSTPTFG